MQWNLDGGGWRLTGDLADVRACLAVVVGFISGSPLHQPAGLASPSSKQEGLTGHLREARRPGWDFAAADSGEGCMW